MLKIKTDNIELLKDAVESLAYKLAWVEVRKNHHGLDAFDVTEDTVKNIIKCEGLEVLEI